MKQRKIVIIRGPITSGKTTTSHELAKALPGWIFIDIWKIKEMFEPLGLRDRTPLKSASKKAVHVIMKEVMKKLGTNIIVQETEMSVLKRRLRPYLKKYNYEIYSFFLDVDFNTAIKRDIQREKPTMHLKKMFHSESEWDKIRATAEKQDFVIDTAKHSVKEVIDIILKEIGEKRKRHPREDAIRKTW